MLRSTLHFLLPTALFASICQAEPGALHAAKPSPSVLKDPASTIWQVISTLGKSEETKKPLENGLVSRSKNRDPFQMPIRGKYRGVSEPSIQKAPRQPEAPQAAVTTFAQAIKHLSVRGIDLASREVLIGSQSLAEGALITIQYNNQPFTAWVRSVDEKGVTFVNAAELTENERKLVTSGPRDPGAMDHGGTELSRLARESSRSNGLIPVSTAGSERRSANGGYGRVEIDQPDVYRLDDFPMNDLFEFLARKAGLQYFFNPDVDNYHVTGELARRADPMESMQELAAQYGLTVYQQGNTVHLITAEKKF
jgi:hypothetical protein